MDTDWTKISARRDFDGAIILSIGGLIGLHARIEPDANSQIVDTAISSMIERGTKNAKANLIVAYYELLSPTGPLGEPGKSNEGAEGSTNG